MTGPIDSARDSRQARADGSTANGPVLLLVTTRSYRAGAFLKAARRAGRSIVVGSDRRQALASLHPQAHLTLDFGDIGRARDAIVAYDGAHPLAAVLAADDDGAALAAVAAEALGLPHHPAVAVEASLDKRRSRERWRAAGLPVPEWIVVPVDNDPVGLATRVRYPCVVKPVSMSASRGVIRADDPASFQIAFTRVAALVRDSVGRRALPVVLVEDYIPGVEVTLEGLMRGGDLEPLALFDKPDPLEGPFFEETIYVTPSRLSTAEQGAVIEMAGRAAAALGLRDGPVHAEFRLNPEGVWPLEIAPRSIGGLCSLALRFEPERSLEDVLLEQALGRGAARPQRERRASGVMMIPIPRAGRLAAVRGVEDAQRVDSIESVRITIPIGDRLVPLPEGARYLGFIFARAATPVEVERALREAHRALIFDIEPEHHAPGRPGRNP
jgi:biotin carboxylase